MKDSEFLKETREVFAKRIHDGCSVYICVEMENIIDVHNVKKGQRQCLRLQNWVLSMIGGKQNTFGCWLTQQGIPMNEWRKQVLIPGSTDTTRKVNLHRLAWLDKLIAICEKEEAAA
jgi:hypothetical protein